MIQFLRRSGELRPPPDTYFLSDVTKLKEELSHHSINTLLYNSLCAFLKIFIVIGNSKINCPNEGNQLSKHVINVFTAKSLTYTGAKSPARCISHSENVCLAREEI